MVGKNFSERSDEHVAISRVTNGLRGQKCSVGEARPFEIKFKGSCSGNETSGEIDIGDTWL